MKGNMFNFHKPKIENGMVTKLGLSFRLRIQMFTGKSWLKKMEEND